jgi:hypothetical protein
MKGKKLCSFLKKRTKKLLFLWQRLYQHRHRKNKSFWFFFSKKNYLLTVRVRNTPPKQ